MGDFNPQTPLAYASDTAASEITIAIQRLFQLHTG